MSKTKEKVLYKYRLFAGYGTVFNVLSKVSTKEELWKIILTSKDDKFNEELYHIPPSGDDSRVGILIRPSLVIAVDTPYGTESVPFDPPQPREEKITSRAIPNRVVINGTPPDPNKNASRNLASRRKLKR